MTDEKTANLDVLEETNTAFDPTDQYLDLSKEEKRRTTALMMAISAYKELIIKEADYLIAASDLARRGEGPEIRPATIDAIVVAAFKFDNFIAGEAVVEASSDDREVQTEVEGDAQGTDDAPTP